MRTFISRIKKQKSYLGLGALAALLISAAGLWVTAPVALAADCDANAFIKCGFTSSQDFINKVRKNDSLNGHSDLQNVYNHYGLSPAEYDRFVTSAKDGTMYRDGRVVVAGKTVLTGGKTLGRENYGGSSAILVRNHTYYTGTPNQRWASGVNSLAVKVLFDNTGTPQFIVLNTCANPAYGTVVGSGAACKMLNKAVVSGKANTYRFTASATATGNASLTKYVYDFGDGTAAVTKTSATDPAEHAFTKPGTYTVKLTVYASAPGDTTIVSTAETCKTTVSVVAPPPSTPPSTPVTPPVTPTPPPAKPTPYYSCVSLTGALFNESDKRTFVYTVTPQYGNGASFVSADFNFGDGSKQTGVKLDDGKVATAKHSYATGGDYTVVATLKFTVGSTSATKTCQRTQTVINPYYRCESLGGVILDQSKYSYRFIAKLDYGNGATFVNGDFDFGDGKTASAVTSTDGKTLSVDHTYDKAGTYSAAVVLRFTLNGQTVTAPTCRAVVTPTTAPTPECKPGIPVGDLRCNPCPYDASISADDKDRCVPPPATTLPNTGAGNVVALGALTLVGGFMWYRHILFRRHKRAYLAADRGVSPLPLAEPFESAAPLAETPLAQAPAASAARRFSMRRRRQF